MHDKVIFLWKGLNKIEHRLWQENLRPHEKHSCTWSFSFTARSLVLVMLESHVSTEFTIVYSLRTYHCASIFDLMILLSRGRLLSQVAEDRSLQSTVLKLLYELNKYSAIVRNRNTCKRARPQVHDQ
jgi:hypothetical protein